MKRNHLGSLTLTVAAALVLSACGKKEEAAAPVVAPAPPPVAAPAPAPTPPPAAVPVSFSALTLGNAVDAGNKVTAAMATFATTDTIYASVDTNGVAASATLAARWTFGDGQLVDESSQSIAPTGPATTTFHISKPSGWPAGSYKVDISLDGAPVASQGFEVK